MCSIIYMKLDKEIVKIKEVLSKAMELLQRNEEDQCSGWTLGKRRLQWHALQQKQNQRSLTWVKNEGLKEVELRQRLMMKEGVHPCEQKQGSFLPERVMRKSMKNTVEILFIVHRVQISMKS